MSLGVKALTFSLNSTGQSIQYEHPVNTDTFYTPPPPPTPKPQVSVFTGFDCTMKHKTAHNYRDFREKGRMSLTQTVCKFSSSLVQALCRIFCRHHSLLQITRVLFLLASFYFRDAPIATILEPGTG